MSKIEGLLIGLGILGIIAVYALMFVSLIGVGLLSFKLLSMIGFVGWELDACVIAVCFTWIYALLRSYNPSRE